MSFETVYGRQTARQNCWGKDEIVFVRFSRLPVSKLVETGIQLTRSVEF